MHSIQDILAEDLSLFLSLRHPAKARVVPAGVVEGPIYLSGTEAHVDDQPWLWPADVLVDREQGSLVGITFPLDDQDNRGLARELIGELDPNVIRYNDLSDSEQRSVYSEPDSPFFHYCEIIWGNAHKPSWQLAQLIFGNYSWLYAPGAMRNAARPVILGFVLDNPDHLARWLGLSFPEVELPLLDVQWG